eukprot:Hpha_TRINITY_DN15763_c5_g15::TRINITY_DN15763_c5_g15_i1::g.37050::m.37050
MAGVGGEAGAAETPSSGEEVLLKLKQMDGTVHEVMAPLAWTVAQLKSEVARAADVPVERQRLVFQGRVLQDTTVLRDLALPSGACVHLVTRSADAPPPAAPAPPPGAAPQASLPPMHAVVRQLDAGAVGQLVQGVLGGLFQPMQPQVRSQQQQPQQPQQQQPGGVAQGQQQQQQQQVHQHAQQQQPQQ